MIINYYHLKKLREASEREKQGRPVNPGEMKPLWSTLVGVVFAFLLIFIVLVLIALLTRP